MFRRRESRNLWKGLVLGALGGIAGVLAMRYYWQAVKTVEGHDPRTDFDESDVPATDALDDISLVGTHHRQGESSTAAIGRLAYRAITGREPQSQETKTALSYLVHWLFSMGMSALYGMLRQRAPLPDIRGGLVLGSGLWLLGDELLMPALGMAKGPTAYPPELHLHSFGAHLAYGAACAAATQALYRLTD